VAVAVTGIATQPAPGAAPRLGALRGWPARRWLLAGLAALVGAAIVGVPTGVIPTPLYTRMTPVRWWNYPVLAASAILLGLTAATYLRPLVQEGEHSGKVATGGGLLSLFAVGCPVCNKLVVLAIGATGALRWFAPLQPVLAIASLAMLGAALWVRLGTEVACRTPDPTRPSAPRP
jgi:hypothetical protein